MDGFQAGIHALLQDIDSNYGDTRHEQSSLPFSRPPSNSHHLQRSLSEVNRQTPAPIHDWQQISSLLPSMRSGTYRNEANDDADLDNFGKIPQHTDCVRSAHFSLDRNLPAEPTNRPSRQSSNVTIGSSPKRLTLPGRTASYYLAEPFERQKTQVIRPGQHCRTLLSL